VQVVCEFAPGVFDIASREIVMNGTTPVAAFDTPVGASPACTTGVWAQRQMRVREVGDQEADPPVGNIVYTVGGVKTSEILPGRGRANIAVWTSGPFIPEQIATIGVQIVSATTAGMDWEARGTFDSRQRTKGHAWIGGGFLLTREPEARSNVVFGVPFVLEPLMDIRLKVRTTKGTARDLAVFIQVSSVSEGSR